MPDDPEMTARLAEMRAAREASAAARSAEARERMERVRAEMGDEPIEAPPWEADIFDLILGGQSDLLGASVRRKPEDGLLVDRPMGWVVHFDDEGLRTMTFGRQYGRLSVVSEDLIFYTDVDRRETKPGSRTARHKVARMLVAVVAERSNRAFGPPVDDYERRLLGFASRLTAPDVPVRRQGRPSTI